MGPFGSYCIAGPMPKSRCLQSSCPSAEPSINATINVRVLSEGGDGQRALRHERGDPPQLSKYRLIGMVKEPMKFKNRKFRFIH